MRRVVVLAAVAFVTAACTIMNDLHLDQVQQPNNSGDDDDTTTPPTDGGKITLADGNVVASQCALKRPPGPPTGVKPGGTDVSITVAMVNMVSEPSGPRIGFDQDGLCTCLENAPEACKATSPHCDGDDKNGLDNSGGELFRTLAKGAIVSINVIEDANLRVQTGVHGNLFKIDGYNGQDDDDDVKVTYYPSPGLGNAPDSTKVQTWPVGTAVPSTKAYVAKRQLVAQFAKIEVFFLDDTKDATYIDNATLTGAITKDAKPTLGGAFLYGRINTTALVQAVGQLAPQSTFQTPLCQAELNGVKPYTAIASGACKNSDLPATAAMDKAGDQACSSISMALDLRLTPAVVGATAPIFRPGDRCTGETPIVCP